MECKEAIEIIRNHLTVLHPDIYGGDGCNNVITALEDFAIPAMMKEICRDVIVEVGISRREYYACPNCMDFIKWRFDANRDNYEPCICPSCGQNLKWRG